MKASGFIRRHIDLDYAVLIVAAGVVCSLLQGYDAPYMFGTIPRAIVAGAVLAMIMTFPFYLYLLGKYTVRGGRALFRHA